MFVIHYFNEYADYYSVMTAESVEEIHRRTVNYGKVIEIFEIGTSVYKATDIPQWRLDTLSVYDAKR